MLVKLMYNKSDNRKINKSLQPGTDIEGELNQELDILTPTLDVCFEGIMRYNYAYIPELSRYYHIVKKTVIGVNTYRLTLAVDLWMSFRRDILNASVVLDKSAQAEHGDEYIDDGSLVTDNYNFKRVISFQQGFNTQPQYILITMG